MLRVKLDGCFQLKWINHAEVLCFPIGDVFQPFFLLTELDAFIQLNYWTQSHILTFHGIQLVEASSNRTITLK